MRRSIALSLLLLAGCGTSSSPDQVVYVPDFDTEIAQAAQIGDPGHTFVLELYDVRDLTAPIQSFPGEDINLLNSGGAAGDVRADWRRAFESIKTADLPQVASIRGLGGKAGPLVNLDDITDGLEDTASAGIDNEFDVIEENPFLDPTRDPLSTFGVDVDTASYAIVRRFLTDGTGPPADAVRIEELLNYFSYAYPEPEGEAPFSVFAQVAECPWNRENRLVRIGLQGRTIAEEKIPPRNLVFLIDVSGSMRSADKLPLVRQALVLLTNRLRPEDRVAVVVYARASGLVLEPTAGSARATIRDAVLRLEAGGSTNGGEGIVLAYELARQSFIEGGINRVILATDGDFNVGVTSRDALLELIEAKRETGVFLTVLGVGTGNLKDSQMEMLADKGNGNYAYLDTLAEAEKVLVREAGSTLITIAKDVKIQVEFNPNRVGAYRLIGYENRKLAARDFNDDRKDAGEIGAGHSVTALYEITPPGSPGPAGHVDPLRYQEPSAPSGSAFGNELLTVKLRYKEPDGQESRLLVHPVMDPGGVSAYAAGEDFCFAAAVAAFGMLLRESKYSGEASYALVAELAQGALGEDPHGDRREFLTLVGKAAKLTQSTTKRGSPEQDHLVYALRFNRLYESLGERVHVRSLVAGAYDFDAGVLQDCPEVGREFAVSIEDQEAFPKKEAIDVVCQITGDLGHECPVWIRGDSDDLDRPGADVDREQGVVSDQPPRGPDLGREEIGSSDHAGV